MFVFFLDQIKAPGPGSFRPAVGRVVSEQLSAPLSEGPCIVVFQVSGLG